MIQVVAHLGPGQFNLTVTGHESDADGRVCAAASAISQAALLGLAELADHHPSEITCTITEQENQL